VVSLDSPITIIRPHLIEFGVGTAERLGKWAADKGYSPHPGDLRCLQCQARRCAGLKGDVTVFADVTPEPDTANLDKVLAAANAADAQLIVGFGGGSAMDLAKLAAVLAGSSQTLHEVVGPNKVHGSAPRRARTGADDGRNRQ
jgi:alcohol dehydrogenase